MAREFWPGAGCHEFLLCPQMFKEYKKRHIFNSYASHDVATMQSGVLQYLMMRVFVALRLHCLLHATDTSELIKVNLFTSINDYK